MLVKVYIPWSPGSGFGRSAGIHCLMRFWPGIYQSLASSESWLVAAAQLSSRSSCGRHIALRRDGLLFKSSTVPFA
jgi:hypothetical protein